ncbi:hypothetical protein [[Mycoplasma] testudinis]|uniref:hypothetical protein n=1 Tax=[Mycoplasma] testudinis TaxID=33924 RepID=UPI000489B6C8|nr:hypothetical protein [[Mycoplasma] testudinis]
MGLLTETELTEDENINLPPGLTEIAKDNFVNAAIQRAFEKLKVVVMKYLHDFTKRWYIKEQPYIASIDSRPDFYGGTDVRIIVKCVLDLW